MHLGDPEPFGDLGLGQVFEESKQEHGSLTFGRRATSGRTVSTSSTLSRLASESPKLLLTDRPSSSPAASGRGRQTTRVEWAVEAIWACTTSSRSIPNGLAISLAVGARPNR